MIEIDEARKIVLSHIRPGPVVALPLEDALYRTTAEAIMVDVDCPPFDRAVMDGYAVRAEDTRAAPVILRVIGRVVAGKLFDGEVQPGQAVQINTGAPMPKGADAVVRIEATKADETGVGVTVLESVKHGKFVTPRGDFAVAGQSVLAPGTILTPAAIGTAATAGAARVRVYRRPSVAILATGDELIPVENRPTAGQVRNSNAAVLRALVESANASPVVLDSARDDETALRRNIVLGFQCDMLCVTGGISAGTLDLVPGVLTSLGSTLHVHKINIKPGRPTIFATNKDEKPIFALPGNPMSAFIGFELLIRPALAKMEGRPGHAPPTHHGCLLGTLPPTEKRRSYYPARADVADDGHWNVQPLTWHGSGDSIGPATANAMIVRAPESPAAREYDEVLFLLIG